jgi:NAD/NADP transhydrogenase alpha subunit
MTKALLMALVIGLAALALARTVGEIVTAQTRDVRCALALDVDRDGECRTPKR